MTFKNQKERKIAVDEKIMARIKSHRRENVNFIFFNLTACLVFGLYLSTLPDVNNDSFWTLLLNIVALWTFGMVIFTLAVKPASGLKRNKGWFYTTLPFGLLSVFVLFGGMLGLIFPNTPISDNPYLLPVYIAGILVGLFCIFVAWRNFVVAENCIIVKLDGSTLHPGQKIKIVLFAPSGFTTHDESQTIRFDEIPIDREGSRLTLTIIADLAFNFERAKENQLATFDFEQFVKEANNWLLKTVNQISLDNNPIEFIKEITDNFHGEGMFAGMPFSWNPEVGITIKSSKN
jgi:hypothetical protein